MGLMIYISREYYTVNVRSICHSFIFCSLSDFKIKLATSCPYYVGCAWKERRQNYTYYLLIALHSVDLRLYTLVGSIKTTVEEGKSSLSIFLSVRFLPSLFPPPHYNFTLGGLTIVVLFEKSMVNWDEDLVINGRASLETLVRR